MKLAGLDFETANGHSGSICAAGVALLDDGAVSEQREWLIRPHLSMDYMLPRFTDIHGISYYDLRDAPEFPAVWASMHALLRMADYVVIHNAPFDLRHLKAALSLYNLPPVKFRYVCSLAVCRFMYPELRCHKLNVMADCFGITFRHHDALEDAAVCATLLSRINFPEKFIKTFEYSENME